MLEKRHENRNRDLSVLVQQELVNDRWMSTPQLRVGRRVHETLQTVGTKPAYSYVRKLLIHTLPTHEVGHDDWTTLHKYV